MLNGGIFFGQVPLFSEAVVNEAHFIFYDELTLMKFFSTHSFLPVYTQRDEVNGFLSFCFRKRL